MPITPFHFGPGVLFHAVSPRRVSFIAFVAANCITDCESVYNVLRGHYPVHRFLHTFVGAALVTAMTVALFVAMRRLARNVRVPDWFEWQQLTLAPVVVGALLGSYSHVVLDGIMHADMRPFAPWSDANPFLYVVSMSTLHWMCLTLGVVGVLLWLKTRPSRPKSVSQRS
ncbi:MAG TPA: metal-dependent hydrolase [Steroidobacteraceae bacterium]|nr:metal-dependent hydrolase [Steroidobacteraceae bacterium]